MKLRNFTTATDQQCGDPTYNVRPDSVGDVDSQRENVLLAERTQFQGLLHAFVLPVSLLLNPLYKYCLAAVFMRI